MSVELDPSDPVSSDAYLQYRALSAAAVAALALGIASCVAPLDWFLLAIPVVGFAVGLFAARRVKKRSEELTGLGMARAGMLLSLVFFVVGLARLSYVYATELPAGYTNENRVSYGSLQPDPDVVGQVVPPAAMELNGKKIFIKGYVYPGLAKDGIKQFLLVRDRGQCCFGGNPKITDRILVTLRDPLRIAYEDRLFKIAGVFRVEPTQAIDNAPGAVLYQLDAEYVD